MISERVVRASLWLSVPFNLGAAWVLAFPGTPLVRALGMSASADPVYRGLAALMVGFFGLAYAWLAMQPRIDQPLLWFGAIGKTGVFVLATMLFLSGAAPGATVVVASGDLAFAFVWFSWLRRQSRPVHGGGWP